MSQFIIIDEGNIGDEDPPGITALRVLPFDGHHEAGRQKALEKIGAQIEGKGDRKSVV